jgi:hypothetical protein
MKDLLHLKEAIYEMGLFFNQQPTDDRITAYARALANYTPQQVIFAFKQVINSGSAFFPSLAEILKHLRPPEERKEDLAPVIVSEMLAALRSHSQYDEKRMQESVSENARLSFLALGNTMDIRLSENIETTKAQLERLVKGVLAGRISNAKVEALEKIGINAKTISISDQKAPMRSLDFSGFES